jgi:transposase-like protein
MTPMNESIMKVDRLGRLRYTREQKKTMVDAYLISGLSAPRFATLHGVNYQTLVSWIKKGNMAGAADPSQSPHPALLSLVPAEIEDSTDIGAGRAMEVLLPSGERIIISSPGQLELAVGLIRELQNSRPC